MSDFRTHSRSHWIPKQGPEIPTVDQIRCGCLQRIADSLERIAGSLQHIDDRFDCSITRNVAGAIISLKKPRRKRK